MPECDWLSRFIHITCNESALVQKQYLSLFPLKVHHSFTATSALTTEHSGGWEMLSLGLFAGVNPYLLRCHPLTELAFFVLNIWLSVDDHCGYDLPWAPHHLVPFGLYGGAPHHDLHHLTFKSNYAPYFTHWDWLAGTLLRHPPHHEQHE